VRVFFMGPRILGGIRPGISFGPDDFSKLVGRPTGRSQRPGITGAFVYVITDGHRIKIGSSIDPNRRLRELQTGNPRPLQFCFVGITPGPGFDIEMRAKDMLRSYRTGMTGGDEWFDTSPEIATAAMMGAAGNIGQKLNAISPSHVGQIVQIAQAGGDEEMRAYKTGKWLAIAFFLTVFVILLIVLSSILPS
jgi:hypothetical protein